MPKYTQLHEMDNIVERVILVSIDRDKCGMDTEACLDELEELAETAGAVTVGRITQKRESVHPAHYLGKGKIEEIKIMVMALDATGIICDDELLPAQIRNLEKMVETKIMDRTMLILDIFAGRAISREGKIQVELAQLKYRLSRLSGLGASMSRMGGGIGTRGPGERKLETDRRYIKERIAELNKELLEIEGHRQLLRNHRDKKGSPVIAMVGYTNSGKSTILNTLTDAGVLAEDKLFATLDTTIRQIKLPGGSDVLLTDTVGFIQKLPHQLIQAFKSTLEELKYADILLHIVDASNIHSKEQIDVVNSTLKELGCEGTPVITVFNKMDRDVELPLPINGFALSNAQISAKKNEGIDDMLTKIETILKSFRESMKVLIPYTDGQIINYIHGKCEIVSEEHTADGVEIEAYVNDETSNRLEKYKMDFLVKS